MKFALLALLVPLALAAAAQTKTDAGSKPAGTAADPNVYSGKSAEGNLQAALADALTKAQAGANKGGADMQFQWELAKVSGKRGGIAGTNEVVVDVRIVK
jgi:hypothetical protein